MNETRLMSGRQLRKMSPVSENDKPASFTKVAVKDAGETVSG